MAYKNAAAAVLIIAMVAGCDPDRAASVGATPSLSASAASAMSAGMSTVEACATGSLRFTGSRVGLGMSELITAATIENLTAHRCRLPPPRRLWLLGHGRRIAVVFHDRRWVVLRPGEHLFAAIGYAGQCRTVKGLRLHDLVIGWDGRPRTHVELPAGWPLGCDHRPAVVVYLG